MSKIVNINHTDNPCSELTFVLATSSFKRLSFANTSDDFDEDAEAASGEGPVHSCEHNTVMESTVSLTTFSSRSPKPEFVSV